MSPRDLVQHPAERVRIVLERNTTPGHQRDGDERQLRDITPLVERCRTGWRRHRQNAEL